MKLYSLYKIRNRIQQIFEWGESVKIFELTGRMVVLLTETEGSRKGIDLGKGISNPIEKLKKC